MIPALMDHLNEDGVLAVQIPINQEEPLFKIIKEVASEYDIWEAIYYHAMPLEEQELFQEEILTKAKELYPIEKNEEILFRFKSLFMVAKI